MHLKSVHLICKFIFEKTTASTPLHNNYYRNNTVFDGKPLELCATDEGFVSGKCRRL